MTARVEVSLIIPVFDCTGKLAHTLNKLAAFLRNAPQSTEVILVDDCGTNPDAAHMLRHFAMRPNVRLLRNQGNRGKGYSVRRGMLEATGRWRVFTDVDLAYPLGEVWNVVHQLRRGADVVIASRVHPASEYVMTAPYLRYLYTRHLMSRAFNWLVRLTLLPGIRDTQAGLKGYSAAAVQRVFPRVQIDGFGFDLECLYLARRLGMRVRQMPVRFRYDDEPSTVRLLHDAATMTGDLARIRWRGITGAYNLDAAFRPDPMPTTVRARVRPLRVRKRAQPSLS